jgi:SAM-dependent methyltransferase
MTSYSGASKIVRFNWPWFVLAVLITVVAVLLLHTGALDGPSVVVAAAVLFASGFWLLASLVVSHYVYDRSPVSRGEWLHGVDPATVRRAVVFHAGQNEASAALARLPASVTVQAFDFYEPTRNGTPSLIRARALAERRDVGIVPDAIPLNDGTLDLGLVVFAAHEIRREHERVTFFRELARALASNGRVLVVEHLRDGWNVLAYGPGALHFLSRRTWIRSFRRGGLTLLREVSCTPFVRVFELGKAS